jgi:hypothetical protein
MTAARIVQIDYVDYGAQGEYGLLGKVVARSEVAGMSRAEIDDEVVAMKAKLGEHVVAVEVELIG